MLIIMPTKKTNTVAPKKTDSKKKTETTDSKTESDSKRVMRKKYNEFGDKDAI